MRSIAESLSILLNTKNEFKELLTILGSEASDDFTSYASKLETLDLESIEKFLSVITDNFTSYNLLFSSMNFEILNCDGWKNEGITSCYGMFKNMSKLTSLSLINFMTPNVLSMGHMFYNCSRLTLLNLSSFNTCNVTDMSCMFYNCNMLESIIGDIDCSNLSNNIDMFYGCTNLRSLSLINIYANSIMNDNDTWSINLGDTKLSDECLVNIISELPDLPSKGIATNANVKLILPINNTLNSTQVQTAVDKGWIINNLSY